MRTRENQKGGVAPMTSTGNPAGAAIYAEASTAPWGGVSRAPSRREPVTRLLTACDATPGTWSSGVSDPEVATRLAIIQHHIREKSTWSMTAHGLRLGAIEPGQRSDVAVLSRHNFRRLRSKTSLHVEGRGRPAQL